MSAFFRYDIVNRITNRDYASSSSGKGLLECCREIERKYEKGDYRDCCRDVRSANEDILRYIYDREVEFRRKKKLTAGKILHDEKFCNKLGTETWIAYAREVQEIGNRYTHTERYDNESDEQYRARIDGENKILPKDTKRILDYFSDVLEGAINYINEKIPGVRGKLTIEFKCKTNEKNGRIENVLEANLTDVSDTKSYKYIWRVKGDKGILREKTYFIKIDKPWMRGKTIVLEAWKDDELQLMYQYGPIKDDEILISSGRKSSERPLSKKTDIEDNNVNINIGESSEGSCDTEATTCDEGSEYYEEKIELVLEEAVDSHKDHTYSVETSEYVGDGTGHNALKAVVDDKAVEFSGTSYGSYDTKADSYYEEPEYYEEKREPVDEEVYEDSAYTEKNNEYVEEDTEYNILETDIGCTGGKDAEHTLSKEDYDFLESLRKQLDSIGSMESRSKEVHAQEERSKAGEVYEDFADTEGINEYVEEDTEYNIPRTDVVSTGWEDDEEYAWSRESKRKLGFMESLKEDLDSAVGRNLDDVKREYVSTIHNYGRKIISENKRYGLRFKRKINRMAIAAEHKINRARSSIEVREFFADEKKNIQTLLRVYSMIRGWLSIVAIFVLLCLCYLLFFNTSEKKHGQDGIVSEDEGIQSGEASSDVLGTVEQDDKSEYLYVSEAETTENDSKIEAWGPKDRESFTWEEPAPYPTFNSIVDNPELGDERNFVRVREADTEDYFSDLVEIEAGKEYEVYIYYHNNAMASLNESGKGIAENVRVSCAVPTYLKSRQTGMIRADITATNTIPDRVWDTAYLKANDTVFLKYVSSSAVLHNTGSADEAILDANSLFSYGGARIAYRNAEGYWGLIPACNEYAGYIIYRLRAVSYEELIDE